MTATPAKTKPTSESQVKTVPCLLSVKDLEAKVDEQFALTRMGITRQGITDDG